MTASRKEVWLRGENTPGLSGLLQPVANALLEAQEEIENYLLDFPEELLWAKPAGSACVGFHLKHIVGVIDRLLTYAEAKGLSEQQFEYLKSETVPETSTKAELLENLKEGVYTAIERLKGFPQDQLTEVRIVGRAAIPSTTIGLCMHSAEHTMRHVGQLLVTAKLLSSGLLTP